MRKLLWLGRIGLATLALVLLPANTQDARLSGAVLCAAEGDVNQGCQREVGSYCMFEGSVVADHRHTS